MNKIIYNIFKYIPELLIAVGCICLYIFTKTLDKSNVYLSLDHLGFIVSGAVLVLDLVTAIFKKLDKNYKTLYLLMIACFIFYFYLYTMYMYQMNLCSKTLSDFVCFICIAVFIYVFAIIFLDLKNKNIYIHVANFLTIVLAIIDFKSSTPVFKAMLILLILALIFESFYLVLDKTRKNVIYK